MGTRHLLDLQDSPQNQPPRHQEGDDLTQRTQRRQRAQRGEKKKKNESSPRPLRPLRSLRQFGSPRRPLGVLPGALWPVLAVSNLRTGHADAAWIERVL